MSNLRGVVRFGRFEVNLSSGELRGDGTTLKLQPQPAKVLALLVSRAGEVVSRAELAEEVWGSQTFVDFEQGLNFAIRQIRTVLGDDADQPRFLETLPKRGYRFIAPVEEETTPVAAAPTSRRWYETKAAVLGAALVLLAGVGYLAWRHFKPPLRQQAVVLAVLPFDDISSDPQEFLVDGLTEEMIAQVTRISPEHLWVIARTSAMQYKRTKKSARQIGQELGADYVLENSIRHEGGQLRVTSQLVRAADQTHLWAESYNRDESELLPLEREVAEGIAEQIRLHLLPSAVVSRPAGLRPVSPEAHELYLKGQYNYNQRSREGLQKSIEYFEQAAAKEPAYAAAYAGLANAYNLIAFYGFDPSLNAISQAKISADKALQLDDSMAAAHAALAYTEFMWRGDWPAAGREFQRALELDINYVPARQWYALYLAAGGRMEDSLKQMREAVQLDPLSPSAHAGLGYIYYLARDYEQAVQQARVAVQLNPNFMVGHAVMGWAYIQQKRYAEAIEELQTAVKLSGGVPVYVCGLGRAFALSGNSVEARKILASVDAMMTQPRGSGSAIAALYLTLGDSEQALHWLERTTTGDVQANWLRVEPAFDPLRGNPRFDAILDRIGKKTE